LLGFQKLFPNLDHGDSQRMQNEWRLASSTQMPMAQDSGNPQGLRSAKSIPSGFGRLWGISVDLLCPKTLTGSERAGYAACDENDGEIRDGGDGGWRDQLTSSCEFQVARRSNKGLTR
jgi:hypothetical protein